MTTMQDLKCFQSERPRFKQYPLNHNYRGWLLYALVYAMQFIPMRISWLFGLLLGNLAALLYRTNTIPVNMELCFPQLSDTKRQRLRRQYFRRLGQSFINLGLAWTGSARRIKRVPMPACCAAPRFSAPT